MSITHTITYGWSGGSGPSISQAVNLTGSEELNFSFSLAGNTTNQQEALAFTKTLLQSIFIYSDTQDITIKTNSTGSPQDTITVLAGDPFVWQADSGITNPFGGNVTTAYFTNAAGTATNVVVKTLTNG